MTRLERPRSLADMATDRLRDDIVNGDIAMGAVLSESALAQTLGISKTPVREALARLRAEGLVTTRPQSGTFVFTPNPKEMRDICDLRTALEPMALTFAVKRNRPALAAALKTLCAEMAEARAEHDTRRYLQLDTAWHDALFEHSDNGYLAEAYRTIRAKMAVLRTHLGTDEAHMAKSFDEHCRMAEAVAAGQLDEALGMLEGHIARKEGSYWHSVGDDPSAPDPT